MTNLDDIERRLDQEYNRRYEEIIRENNRKMWTMVYIPFLVALSGLIWIFVMTFVFKVTEFQYFILPLCLIFWGQYKLVVVGKS